MCGEPCADQKCIICLTEDEQRDIVDFIMQRRLDEIDLSSSDLSDRLITLSCGHLFTVETLDGHCKMSEFYEVDPATGSFLSTKAPPVNYQTPPTCPTCRGSITALRYGRITKRATLDILEQNVASTMSRALDACAPELAVITSDLDALKEKAEKVPVGVPEELDSDEDAAARPDVHSFALLSGPLPVDALDTKGMHNFHGMSNDEAKAWNNVVRPVLQIYRRIVGIACTRGAHVKAYEGARSTLYREAFQSIATGPSDANSPADAPAISQPENVALQMVDRLIGQPPPKADVRFQVEAYFMSLEVRALLAQLAQARVEALGKAEAILEAEAHRARWEAFVTFLYEACGTDAKKAQKLARDSRATRQAARAALFGLRFDFELFRWRTMCERGELVRRKELEAASRNALSIKVKRYKIEMFKTYQELQRDYKRERPSKTMDDLKSEQRWLDENCGTKVDAWQKECNALEEFIMKDGFYEPLSLQERQEIVKAFEFCKQESSSCRSTVAYRPSPPAHRGHFYNCENGHTFVITEVRPLTSIVVVYV